MDRNSNINDSGVLISQDAIENSLHKKAQRKLTLAQLPVYRAAGNLKFVIIGIAKNAPRTFVGLPTLYMKRQIISQPQSAAQM